MILPERVLGSSGTTEICRGLAIGGDLHRDVIAQFLDQLIAGVLDVLAQDHERDDALPGGLVGGTDHGGLGDRRMRHEADSTSEVEMRCPLTFMTSSTRPSTHRAPSSSYLAPSPAKYQPCSA